MQAAPGVVELVQVFDQQVTPVAAFGPPADQRANLGQRNLVGLAALEFAFAADALAHVVQRGQGHGGNGNRKDRGSVHDALSLLSPPASN